MPATGTDPPSSPVSPNTPALGRASGSDAGSTPSSSHSSGSQLARSMSNSSVRDAFE